MAAACMAVVAVACNQPAEKVSKVPQTSAPTGRTAPTSTTTTTTLPPLPPTTATVGTAEQLRERLATQGICTDEEPSVAEIEIVPISSTVTCTDGYRIFVVPSRGAFDQAVDLISRSLCFLPFYLAVSDTWIVYPTPPTAFRAGRVIEVLGGVVQEVPCRFVPEEQP